MSALQRSYIYTELRWFIAVADHLKASQHRNGFSYHLKLSLAAWDDVLQIDSGRRLHAAEYMITRLCSRHRWQNNAATNSIGQGSLTTECKICFEVIHNVFQKPDTIHFPVIWNSVPSDTIYQLTRTTISSLKPLTCRCHDVNKHFARLWVYLLTYLLKWGFKYSHM